MKGHFGKRRYRDPASGKIVSASTWTVWYDEPRTIEGARKRKTKSGFRTRKEAEAWFSRRSYEIANGAVGTDEKATLEAYLTDWLAAIARDVSASALHAYENHVRVHIIPALGRLRLQNLRASHIEAAKEVWLTTKIGNRHEGTISARTAKHIFTTLNSALNRAKKQRVIHVNPCELVDAPRFERKEMRAYNADEAAKLFVAFEGTEIGAAIVTDLGTGLRRGELLALQWGDVDLDARTIMVQRSIERADGVVRFKEPKTKRSRRSLGLPGFVVDRLRRHRIEQAQRYLAAGLGRPTETTLIFERGGEPWIPNTFGHVFAKALAAAELPRIRLHDLRHSFATMALASGIDLKTVSSALGHSTLATTADIYAHATPSMLSSAAERLDRVVGKAMRKASGGS